MITSFSKAGVDTPAGKIYKTIVSSLNYMAYDAFVKKCTENILALASGLTIGQSVAIKMLAIQYGKDPSQIDDVLLFVLYGGFESVGLEEVVSEPLTKEQRAGMIAVIYNTAAQILTAKAIELTESASWEYDPPDWFAE